MKRYKALFEKKVGDFPIDFKPGSLFELYVNPPSLKNFHWKWIRGVIDSKGNFYIANAEEVIHGNMLKILFKNNLINKDYSLVINKEDDLNTFYPSLDDPKSRAFTRDTKGTERLYKLAKKKNPKYNFVLE
jgi:hypothetical protein